MISAPLKVKFRPSEQRTIWNPKFPLPIVIVQLLPPRRGQPLSKGQRTHPQLVPCREAPLYKGQRTHPQLVPYREAPLYKPIPNLSLVERFYCIRDKGPIPNSSLVDRLHCIRDKAQLFSCREVVLILVLTLYQMCDVPSLTSLPFLLHR